jgi:hypothetical protein
MAISDDSWTKEEEEEECERHKAQPQNEDEKRLVLDAHTIDAIITNNRSFQLPKLQTSTKKFLVKTPQFRTFSRRSSTDGGCRLFCFG